MLRCEIYKVGGPWPSFRFFDEERSLQELHEIVFGLPLDGVVPRELKLCPAGATRIGEDWVSVALSGTDEDAKTVIEALLRAGVSVRLVEDEN